MMHPEKAAWRHRVLPLEAQFALRHAADSRDMATIEKAIVAVKLIYPNLFKDE